MSLGTQLAQLEASMLGQDISPPFDLVIGDAPHQVQVLLDGDILAMTILGVLLWVVTILGRCFLKEASLWQPSRVVSLGWQIF